MKKQMDRDIDKKSKARRYSEIIFGFSVLVFILYLINNTIFNQTITKMENEINLLTSNEFEMRIESIEKEIDYRWMILKVFGEIFSDTDDLVEERDDLKIKLKEYKEKYAVEEFMIVDEKHNYVSSDDYSRLDENYLFLIDNVKMDKKMLV